MKSCIINIDKRKGDQHILVATKILLCTAAGGCPNPRADQNPEATNRHCNPHRIEANRKINATRLEKQYGKGFVLGAEAMRNVLVTEFASLGAGMMSGQEAAWYISQALGPIANTDKGPVEEKK